MNLSVQFWLIQTTSAMISTVSVECQRLRFGVYEAGIFPFHSCNVQHQQKLLEVKLDQLLFIVKPVLLTPSSQGDYKVRFALWSLKNGKNEKVTALIRHNVRLQVLGEHWCICKTTITAPWLYASVHQSTKSSHPWLSRLILYWDR